jgi:alkanesulfonate monooxygenase SsuD/methylene tetrahydromethanopterin reductase-like flavin-dependent oxidoreductase (luciferase family)
LRALGESLPRIKERLAKLTPPPLGDIPILIGGRGEKVTLRLVAEHAAMWNTFESSTEFARLSAVLDEHCAAIGRDPREIERTALVSSQTTDAEIDELIDVGVQHVIFSRSDPFDFTPVRQLLARR